MTPNVAAGAHRLWARVASGNEPCRAAAGEDLPSRASLVAIVVQHLTVARVADGLAVAWDTAKDAVVGEGQRVLIGGTLAGLRTWP